MLNKQKDLIGCNLNETKTKEIIYSARLKDNSRTCFYFIDPSCKECITIGLRLLKSTSKKFRFNYALNKFSKKELEYLTHLDNYNHLAIGCRYLENRNTPGIGIARYIRLPEKPDTAEIAITILDKYHNQGLGTIFMALLIKYSLKNKIIKHQAYVQADNQPMLGLLKKFNFTIKKKGYSLIHMETDLNQCREKALNIIEEYVILPTFD